MRKREEQGERSTYTARYRINIGPCTGWDTSRDPSTLPDTSLVQVINARIEDGIVVSRGGQEVVSEVADASGTAECIYGLVEVEGGVTMFLSPRDATDQGMLDIYSTGLATPYVRLSTDTNEAGIPTSDLADCFPQDASKARYCFTLWREKFLMASGTNVIYEIVVPEHLLDISKFKVHPLFEIPTGKVPSSMFVIPGFNDTVYIGTTDGFVYRYDGTTLSDMSLSGSGRVILFSLLGILHAASAHSVKRYLGGSWSAIAIPAGTPPTGITDFRVACGFEFNGNAYVGGWDDTTGEAAILVVAPAGTATMGVVFNDTTAYYVTDFASFQGKLYYLWEGLDGVTQTHGIVEYNTSNIIKTDLESSTAKTGRLYPAGDLLFVGYNGNAPALTGDPVARLASWDGSAGSLVLIQSFPATDLIGPVDMIAV